MLLMVTGTLLVSCTAATGKGSDYVVYTARRGSTFVKVQVTLPVDKVCVATSRPPMSEVRIMDESSDREVIRFDLTRSNCQQPGDRILDDLFRNGTDYTVFTDGGLRMPLLDRDPLTGQDV